MQPMNRKQRRANFAEIRDARTLRQTQKHMARPSRQNMLTDGMLKVSDFWARLGLQAA